jgi:plasmid maintenance system killer protein
MIVSYRDKKTERFANGEHVRNFQVSHDRLKRGSIGWTRRRR